jgi:flagellin-like protein
VAQRRGISNVVATIILIAVAIALAVAVAIWVFGIFKGSAHATTLNA